MSMPLFELWDRQVPDAGEAEWVPDTSVSLMQNGKQTEGREPLPQARAEMGSK